MELNPTTFAFEILNFLVLLWILSRFLFKPVQKVLADRAAGVAAVLREADTTRTAAADLQQQYESRLEDWNSEKTAARLQLEQEMDAERTRQMKKLEAELEKQREKNQAREAGERDQLAEQCSEQALRQSGAFATALLSRLADPHLEERLIAMALEDLPRLDVKALKEERSRIAVTAFPLPEHARETLRRQVDEILGPGDWQFEQDPKLLSGLRLTLGPWTLGASLADELSLFAEATRAKP